MEDEKNIDVPVTEEITEIDDSSAIYIHDEQWSLLLEQNDLQNEINESTNEQISILNDNILSLNEMVSTSSTTTITYDQAETIIALMNDGLYMFGLVVGGVFLWFVLKQLYRLFGGLFFGGI